MNQRKHWAWVSKTKRAWREAAYFTACSWESNPTHRRQPGLSLVSFVFPVTTNRRRDPHNYYPTIKPIIDGLTDAGLWPDDTAEYVATREPEFTSTQDLVSVRIEHVWHR